MAVDAKFRDRRATGISALAGSSPGTPPPKMTGLHDGAEPMPFIEARLLNAFYRERGRHC